MMSENMDPIYDENGSRVVVDSIASLSSLSDHIMEKPPNDIATWIIISITIIFIYYYRLSKLN